jgi:gas vesicle protein
MAGNFKSFDGKRKRRKKMKYEESDYETGPGSWFLSFVLGGLVGAAVALLMAPKSGRQTREQIKDMAQDARERAGGYYDQAKGKLSTAMQKGADVFQQKKSEMESAVAQGKEAFQKARETVTES